MLYRLFIASIISTLIILLYNKLKSIPMDSITDHKSVLFVIFVDNIKYMFNVDIDNMLYTGVYTDEQNEYTYSIIKYNNKIYIRLNNYELKVYTLLYVFDKQYGTNYKNDSKYISILKNVLSKWIPLNDHVSGIISPFIKKESSYDPSHDYELMNAMLGTVDSRIKLFIEEMFKNGDVWW